MNTPAIIAVILLVGVAVAKNCDQLGTLIYEDMGCKPIYDSPKSCPVSYECKGIRRSTKHCYFKQKMYRIDEQVDSHLTAIGCDLGCYCERANNTMRFSCASVECSEWTRKPTNSGCYRKYSLDSCCSIRESCPPYDNSTSCVYDGRQYKEGANILPRDSCWRCVCQDNWNGKIEPPLCKRRTCNVQIKHQDKIQQACAPIYYKRAYRDDDPFCCPNNWICSNNKEVVKGKPTSDKTCQFGNKKLKIGQSFIKDVSDIMLVKQIQCECKIPPLLTCTAEIV
ncbi:kielin/chordin-like protein [Aethina tumida]|uniref:kielin/chordin-like protein n=1 Tax=Aethina tumida TaxID=116153 RepID=UPI0021478C98|nr:kielin/chordin-like protein [Aethina tumida]